ncbi:hypothetical protein CL621_03530 [archaeon]|nr:hypothetical protein [archaeon]|tara:strand:- start:759 stop:1028 length:270 start_codon:yes stop_codon:yes gene_type:complete
MEYQDLIKIVNKQYANHVKFKIDREDYSGALIEMSDLVVFMNNKKSWLVEEVDKYLNCISSARELYRELKGRDKEGIERAKRDFEAKFF